MSTCKEKAKFELSVPAGLDVPEGFVPVELYTDRSVAADAGLAVLAMGEAYWLILHEENYILCVREKAITAVRQELDAVSGMRLRHPQRSRFVYEDFEVGYTSFILYGLVLIALFIAQQGLPLVDRGAGDAVAIIRAHEYWRIVTALGLHGDLVHLVSNLVAGMGFAFFVARFFGAAAGWLLIFISGVLGNGLNAWVYYPEAHLSIGASTAIFGALGLLTGVGVRAALSEPDRRLNMPLWFVPVFGGLTLLGLLGMGDYRVDVAAHISGFFCGGLIGFVAAFFQSFFRRVQGFAWLSGALVLGTFAIAWCFAI
ncbi:rhomboid family intramembrane serine protease [Coraliomargarita parva]|uniref:rhomboid family intramembrane serine protease n=1 Tax=Coraliomargarita parva TaxID=3014050 RepID=UPI0022B57379|nr:rhomboid family intramembrane serine protease [Coraliomargarita parva]